MKNFFSLLKVAILLLTCLFFTYYDGTVSFRFKNNLMNINLCAVVFACGFLVYMCALIKKIILRMFAFKSNYENGLESLQQAFFSVLLKDKLLIGNYIKKSKKYLGNMPIVSWLDGQQSLINGDNHGAKATFYNLCEQEKNTAFGAYSIYQMAIKEQSWNEALDAINSVLKVSQNTQSLSIQAIAISIRNKNFAEAKKHIPYIKKSDKFRLIEAIIYSEEGLYENDIDLLKKAFKQAPELSDNAVNYAELLIRNNECKSARDVLKKSFKAFPNQKVFDKYIVTGENLSNLDKISLAKKLVEAVPESWIGYFELAKLFIQENMPEHAFHNFMAAYEKEPFDFIETELIETAKSLENPKPDFAINILSKPLKSKHINFIWKCSNCGTEKANWAPICEYCNSIAEYEKVAQPSTLSLL